LPQASITVIAKDRYFYYRPASIYVPFGLDVAALATPIEEPLRRKRIQYVHGEAKELLLHQQRVVTEGGLFDYDALVLATGSTSATHALSGLTEHGRDITCPWQLLDLRRSLSRATADAQLGRRTRFLFLVPPDNRFPGPLLELACLMDTWLTRQDCRNQVDIAVATWEKCLFEAYGGAGREAVRRELADRRIDVHTACCYTAVRPDHVNLDEDRSLPFDTLVTYPARAGTLRLDGLRYSGRGFVDSVTRTRQAVGPPNVFVVGDLAADQNVKQAFSAFRQAEVAAHHIVCQEQGLEPTLFYDDVSRFIFDTGDAGLLLESAPDGTVGGSATKTRLWHTTKRLLGEYLTWRVERGQPFSDPMVWAGLGETLRTASRVLGSSHSPQGD
jgi:NADH dehydrogenase FAD-containing subunit